VLQSANVVQSEDQFRQINVPDVSPGNIPAGVDFSMAGGDFLEAFSDPEGNSPLSSSIEDSMWK